MLSNESVFQNDEHLKRANVQMCPSENIMYRVETGMHPNNEGLITKLQTWFVGCDK